MNASGNTTAVNTFGPYGLVSRIASSTVYYLFDPQGSVASRLNGSQTVLSSDQYDAYGNRWQGDTTDVFGYAAQWGYHRDAETGVLLLTNRYYDPRDGRFLTRDPIGYAGGINLYGAVQDNPMTAADPFGLCRFCGVQVPTPRPDKITDEVLYWNMGAAAKHPFSLTPRGYANMRWFEDRVRNHGPWDYKQLDPSKYQNFGNFHYGAVAAAAGIPLEVALEEAGRGQIAAGTSRPDWGKPGSRAGAFVGRFGDPPYGDDPCDQEQIKKGYRWGQFHWPRPWWELSPPWKGFPR